MSLELLVPSLYIAPCFPLLPCRYQILNLLTHCNHPPYPVLLKCCLEHSRRCPELLLVYWVSPTQGCHLVRQHTGCFLDPRRPLLCRTNWFIDLASKVFEDCIFVPHWFPFWGHNEPGGPPLEILVVSPFPAPLEFRQDHPIVS